MSETPHIPNRDKHLTYFKVENFKRFDSFEMENIGQFNLIVGDNNVGKTSVLEALLVDEESNRMNTYWNSVLVDKRYILSQYETAYSIFVNSNNNTKPISFIFITNKSVINTLEERININIKLDKPNSTRVIHNCNIPNWTSDFNDSGTNPNFVKPFVSAFKMGENELFSIFSQQISDYTSTYEEFIKSLKVFFSDITEVVIGEKFSKMKVFKVRLKSQPKTQDLNSFGDGTIRAFEILVKLMTNAGSRLLIDELEAGIHYSRMKDYIKVILAQAYKLNVQLFLTTHSEECLEYYKMALDELGTDYQDNARLIGLDENQNKSVIATTYNFDQFAFHVEKDIELRGHEILEND